MNFKYIPPRKKHFQGPKKNVSFRFPEDLVDYYESLADELGISVTELVIDVLDQAAIQIQETSRPKRKAEHK